MTTRNIAPSCGIRARPTRRRRMLEPWLSRAARAALGWSRERLAEESGVSAPTIQRYERGEVGLYETVRKLRAALERGGVEFLEATKDRGPGLTLRQGRKS